MSFVKKLLSGLPLGVVLVLISGCASLGPPAPIDFKGPTAVLKETVMPYGSSKADFFVLESIDGQRVQNSVMKTRVANAGKGLNAMLPSMVNQMIPAKATTFKVKGRTEYSAPIQALTNPVYEVSGDIVFAPEIDKVYAVKGELGKNYSAVWIEEESTHTVVGKKIELKTALSNTAEDSSPVVPFKGSSTGFVAARTFPHSIAIDLPLDMRPEHATKPVAGSDWHGCKIDPIWAYSAPQAIQQRIREELGNARLFTQVHAGGQATPEWRLKTEIHAFCGDTRRLSLIEYRGAGISSFLFSLERQGKIVWQGKIEKVVKDNEPAYSGSLFTTENAAITHLMSDSLRLVLKDLFEQLSNAAIE